MKLVDLQKPISEMSEDELLIRLREIKHNRFVERPAVKAREEREEAQETRRTGKKAVNKVDKMLDSMSDEQREQLIKLLSGDSSGAQT